MCSTATSTRSWAAARGRPSLPGASRRAGARVRDPALGGLVRAPRFGRQRPHRGARARRQPLLRLRLHPLAQALDSAEHRDRWRCRRVPAARRVCGRDRPLELPALCLFLIVFFWTPPHFWALALMFKNAYAAAGVPMLPVVCGDRETARQIVLYSIVMVAFTVVVGIWLGPLYTVAAVALGAVFIVLWPCCCGAISRGRARRCSSTTRSSTSHSSSPPQPSTRCSSDESRARPPQPALRMGALRALLADLRRHNPRRRACICSWTSPSRRSNPLKASAPRPRRICDL